MLAGLARLEHLLAIGWGHIIGALQLARPHQSGPGVAIKLDLVEIAHGTVYELNRADRACAHNRADGAESDTIADLEFNDHRRSSLYGKKP
jgi:hypothetical protein